MTSAPPIATDADSIALYSDYTGVPIELVAQCTRNFAGFNHVTWSECEGTTWLDKARVYYERHDEYLFDLLYGSRSKAWRRQLHADGGHWPWMIGAGRDVLEFGGGLGFTCSLLHDEGRRVTYCDVNGPAVRFARWYFGKCGQEIEILLTPSERLVLPAGRQWDLVFTESVIEHVPDPAGTVERLAQAVKPGGLLYLIIDAHEVSPAFPMHQHVYLKDLLAGAPTLSRMHHVRHDGDGLNAFRMPR